MSNLSDEKALPLDPPPVRDASPTTNPTSIVPPTDSSSFLASVIEPPASTASAVTSTASTVETPPTTWRDVIIRSEIFTSLTGLTVAQMDSLINYANALTKNDHSESYYKRLSSSVLSEIPIEKRAIAEKFMKKIESRAEKIVKARRGRELPDAKKEQERREIDAREKRESGDLFFDFLTNHLYLSPVTSPTAFNKTKLPPTQEEIRQFTDRTLKSRVRMFNQDLAMIEMEKAQREAGNFIREVFNPMEKLLGSYLKILNTDAPADSLFTSENIKSEEARKAFKESQVLKGLLSEANLISLNEDSSAQKFLEYLLTNRIEGIAIKQIGTPPKEVLFVNDPRLLLETLLRSDKVFNEIYGYLANNIDELRVREA